MKKLKTLSDSMEESKASNETQEKPRSLTQAKRTGLLSLPLEIRLMIYHYCIPRRRVVYVTRPRFGASYSLEEVAGTKDVEDDDYDWDYEEEDHNWLPADEGLNPDELNFVQPGTDYAPVIDTPSFSNGAPHADLEARCFDQPKTSLLRVSKQISEEALDVLYGENFFKLNLHDYGEAFLRKRFSERNRQRMRYILVVARPFVPGQTPDHALWSLMLPNLKTFRLVAEPPPGPARCSDFPDFSHNMEDWVEGLKPFLECFGRHLRSTTRVQLDDGDDDGAEETTELVQQYLTKGHQKVRCRLMGDFVFKRGRFYEDPLEEDSEDDFEDDSDDFNLYDYVDLDWYRAFAGARVDEPSSLEEPGSS